ncbi:hypothetical protein Amsp01_092050 [Amycolatopsis sp. NBRC 101858]|nr:hypothetical protein Amsp01_092050 [Amycolatopsis sp. NBRC 101858]
MDPGVLVEHADGFPAGVRAFAERLEQAGLGERDLPGVGVDVERTALLTGGGRRIRFVDGDGPPVALEDSRAGQSAQACADDRDAGCRHGFSSPFVRYGTDEGYSSRTPFVKESTVI